MFFSPTLSQDALIATVLKSTPLEYAPGTRHQYSNFGYSVLGRIIERVTGKPYETAMRDGVLAPSGAASFAVGGDTLSDKLPGRSHLSPGRNGWTSPYGMPVRRMDAHGGWIATPIDVLRVAVRADGFNTVPDLLNPSSMATMTTRTTAPDTDGKPANYAKGWAVNDVPNWWHSGYLPGTQSMLIRTANRYGPTGTRVHGLRRDELHERGRHAGRQPRRAALGHHAGRPVMALAQPVLS